MNSKIAEGIRLFNSQKFFEAHESLEEVWLKTKGREKVFLHGLIQVAAAFHHHTRRNSPGFRSLLEKGLTKLEEFGESVEGIDLGRLRNELQPWRERLKTTAVASEAGEWDDLALPRIEVNRAIGPSGH